jgi:hypothetical protein
VRAGEQHIAVGTDSPKAANHFLSVLDGESILQDSSRDAVVCSTAVSEHLSDVKWLDATNVIAATGTGNLKVFHFDLASRSIRHGGEWAK